MTKNNETKTIKRAQTMYNVKVMAINTKTYAVEEKVMTCKSDDPAKIEKRFNELFDNLMADNPLKYVKTIATEPASFDWREMPETKFKKLGTCPATGFEVKATIATIKVVYYVISSPIKDEKGKVNTNVTLERKTMVLNIKVGKDDEDYININPNINLNVASLNGERVAYVEKVTTESKQYGMDLATWLANSTPCEPPKKREKKN